MAAIATGAAVSSSVVMARYRHDQENKKCELLESTEAQTKCKNEAMNPQVSGAILVVTLLVLIILALVLSYEN